MSTKIKIPRGEYPIHPEVSGEGVCLGWFDEGENETQYGMKHQVSIRIRSTSHFYTAKDADGNDVERAHTLYRRMNLASGFKARLHEYREKLLARALTPSEMDELDFAEADGVPVRYEVVHYRQAGVDRPFVRIEFLKRILDGQVVDVFAEKQDIIEAVENRKAELV